MLIKTKHLSLDSKQVRKFYVEHDSYEDVWFVFADDEDTVVFRTTSEVIAMDFLQILTLAIIYQGEDNIFYVSDWEEFEEQNPWLFQEAGGKDG